MKTPTHIKISIVTILLLVAVLVLANAIQKPEHLWKSGATTVTLKNGMLTIRGKGAMKDHGRYPPWYDTRNAIISVIIKNGVTSIGDWAFSNCHNLTSITIPNSVITIGNMAFNNCYSLTSIIIPNSVTTIKEFAFFGCTGLTSITIPNSVTNIGEGAFLGCASLTSIMIPNSVTTIGRGAFLDCASLTSIEIATDNTRYSSMDGVMFNKNKTSLILYPQSREGAYTIPSSVTIIEEFAFSGCTGLTSITIPNSVTAIGAQAFEGCTGLKSVTIPNSVTTIGEGAFLSCTGLTSITSLNPVPTTIKTWTFHGVSKNACLYVPKNSIAAYRFAEHWKDFKCIKPIPHQTTHEN